MTSDRERADDALMSAAEVRRALGMADSTARNWLRDNQIVPVHGYPRDEVTEAAARRPGRGRWGPRHRESENGGEAEDHKD